MSIYGRGLQNHKITDKQKNYLGGATHKHRRLSGTSEKNKDPQSLMGIEQRGNKTAVLGKTNEIHHHQNRISFSYTAWLCQKVS